MKPITTTERITEQGGITALFFNDIRRLPSFANTEEENAVATLAARGDEKAKRELIDNNLRFVITVANAYQCDRIPALDLINEGTIGLMKAADTYDPSRGVKFISFAVWWIKKHISEHILENYNMVSAPTNKSYSLKKYDKLKAALEQELGYEADFDIVMLEYADKFSKGEQEYIRAASNINNMRSLDDALGDDGDGSYLRDFIEYEDQEDFSDTIDDKRRYAKLYGRMNRLSSREKKVIELCYGLKSGESVSEDVAADIMDMNIKTFRKVKERAENALMF